MALYLTEADVRQVLDMSLALSAVEDAHRALSQGRAQDLPRQRTRTPKLALHLLQASYTDQRGVSVTGFKAYTSSRAGNRFLIHLYDGSSGALRAMISADWLGMIRTGAASGVASRWLAKPQAHELAIFGTGWQAEGHLAAQLAVLPFEKISVIGRDATKRDAFATKMQKQYPDRRFVSIPPENAAMAVAAADVVGTITTSASPVLETDWVNPGTHFNAAGSNALIRRELPEDLIRKSCPIVVDTVETALRESGDLLPLLEKGRLLPRQLVELGDIITGRVPVQYNSQGFSIFESQGLGVQDMAVALGVLERAVAQGLGVELPIAFAADAVMR
jgi:alanine dehydrogenase